MIDEIVAQTGISQTALAKYLDVSQSQLSKQQAGLRQLPNKAVPHIAWLQASMAKLSTPAAPAPTPAEKLAMEEEAAFCRARCQQLEKQLTTMQQQYEQAARLAALVVILQQRPENQTPKRLRLMEQLQYESSKKMAANGWQPQQKLKTNIEQLRVQAG